MKATGSKHGSQEWNHSAVRYILSNEKYTGDSLFGKWYTTSTLPFRCVENKGQQDMYYVAGHHEPIITHEDFNAVQKLLEKRGEDKKERVFHEKCLSGKIYCGECGTLFRFKQRRDTPYWVCRNHDHNGDVCGMKQIPEQIFYDAFIRLYNKLKQNQAVIFASLLSQLQELKNRKHRNNKQYLDISKEIAGLREQTHVLARLKTKGFLDDAKYMEQINEINGKISRHELEMRQLLRCDGEDELIEQIKDIASIIEKGADALTEFDKVLFESLIEKIIVVSRNEFEFVMYGGLKLTEKIKCKTI